MTSHSETHDKNGGAPGGAPQRSYFGTLTKILNLIGTLLILTMALAVNADVVGRNLFNHPIPGVLEFIGWSIVAVVFLQMANTLREGRHVSNDILMSFVVETRPRVAAGIFALFDLIGAILMAVIIWYMWPIVATNYNEGYYAGTAGVVEIPIWPFMAAVLIGAIATCLQFFVHAWGGLQKARGAGAI